MSITKISLDELHNNKLTKAQLEQIEKLKNMSDEDIDLSDMPELTKEQLAQMKPAHIIHPEWFKPKKKSVQIRIDVDVLEALKAQGKGYQTRINSILREAVLG